MVSIVEVTTKAQLRRFVDYPNQLYRGVPQFVPATYGDDLSDWDRQKNPAFSYCDARCWLAERDGEIVGRIGAIRSRKANEKWGTNRMRFTQVDFIDDPEVSAALFAAVEDWARELGCTAVHGPLGFTDMDREGMLVEGFDRYAECWFGRSAADAPDIDGKVFFTSRRSMRPGEFVSVRITDVMDWDLMGEVAE